MNEENNNPNPNENKGAQLPVTNRVSSEKVIQPITPDLIQNAPQQVTYPTATPQPDVQSDPAPAPLQNITAIQPDTSANENQGTYTNSYLTGSQLVPEKTKLPTGIYIITGFNLLAFVISFFDTSQNSGIYSLVMLVDLMLAIGLLFRLELARKIIIWLTGITLVLTVASVFMLVALQQRLDELESNYQNAVSKIDKNQLTPTQKKQLETMNAKISEQQKQAGKAIGFTYAKLGVTAVGGLVIITYLTRPKIKSVFRHLEK